VLTRSQKKDDGDVSSANASVRRPHPSSSPTRSRHPLAFPPSTTGSLIPLAPVLQSQPSHFADSSTPPSPRGSPIASRHPGHGGLDKPTAWAAAPTGFLSSLTPEEIQVRLFVLFPPLSLTLIKQNKRTNQGQTATRNILGPQLQHPIRIEVTELWSLRLVAQSEFMLMEFMIYCIVRSQFSGVTGQEIYG
jgi:hypothetical protein